MISVKINVRVKPGSKSTKSVEAVTPDLFDVFVTEPAEGGKANAAVIKSVAKHFHLKPSNVQITSGFKSKLKTLHLDLHPTPKPSRS